MIRRSVFQKLATDFILVATLGLFLCSGTTIPRSEAGKKAVSGKSFMIGVVTDIQYADKETQKERHYRVSFGNLKKCVDYFNKKKPAFTIQLGDVIDGHGKDSVRSRSDLDSITGVIKQLRIPLYHVLGNHDLAAGKEYLLSELELSAFYYDFTVPSAKGWRFIVLDGNDAGYGIMGEEQTGWFRSKINDAEQNGEKVVCFCHFALTKSAAKNHYMAKPEPLLNILDSTTCVVAWFAGHDHAGGYALRNGVHHVTLMGMVEAPVENSFATVRIYPGRIIIKGKGKEESRKLYFK